MNSFGLTKLLVLKMGLLIEQVVFPNLPLSSLSTDTHSGLPCSERKQDRHLFYFSSQRNGVSINQMLLHSLRQGLLTITSDEGHIVL